MGVRFRWPQLVAVAVVFGAGWGTAALSRGPAPVSSPRIEPVTAAVGTTCDDPVAMEANANLVREVSDYRRRLADAEEQRAAADAKLARAAAKDNERLSASTDEWKRMARDGTVRVRIPCASWDGAGRFSLRRATQGHSGHITITSHRSEKVQRAAAAGFSSEELETLAEVYHRVNARAWASVRASCEANAMFRESIGFEDEPTDASRLATCRSSMVDVNEAEGRTAVAHFAALRAAGTSVQRAADDSERLLFALSDTQQTLEEEMVRAFGREKTTRAIDNGVTCFDETTYDTHDPGSEG